jgi:hypothetical protein
MQNEVNGQADSSEWSCRHCTLVFDTRGRRDGHLRREHQMISTTGSTPGVKQTLNRSDNGMFICSCAKSYHHAQSLKRHQEACDLAADIPDVEMTNGSHV